MVRGNLNHVGICLESRFLLLELLTVYLRSSQTIGSNLWLSAFTFALLPYSSKLSEYNRIRKQGCFICFYREYDRFTLKKKHKSQCIYLNINTVISVDSAIQKVSASFLCHSTKEMCTHGEVWYLLNAGRGRE